MGMVKFEYIEYPYSLLTPSAPACLHWPPGIHIDENKVSRTRINLFQILAL